MASNIQLDASGGYSFRMPSDDITVEAVLDTPYSVLIDENIENGSISISTNKAAQGSVVKIVPTANDGFVLEKISGSGVDIKAGVDALGEKAYTFTMPKHDVTLTAAFISNADISAAAPSGAAVKYGTAAGVYDLDESPKYTAAGTYTVYYRITADGYETKTGAAQVIISTNGDVDLNGVIEKADAALLLKYLGGTATLNEKQLAAARMTDSTKEKPDMLDVIAIIAIVEAPQS